MPWQVQFKAAMGERGPVASEVQVVGGGGAMGMAMGWPQAFGQQWGFGQFGAAGFGQFGAVGTKSPKADEAGMGLVSVLQRVEQGATGV